MEINGSCVLKAPVGRLSAATIGRVSVDISVHTPSMSTYRPILGPYVDRVSADSDGRHWPAECRSTYRPACRPRLGRHVADSSCQKEVSGTPSKVPKSSCQNQQVKISSDEFEGEKKGNFETFWNFLEFLRVSQKLLFDNYYAKISTRLFLEK